VRKLSILLLLFYTTNVFSADTVNELKNKILNFGQLPTPIEIVENKKDYLSILNNQYNRILDEQELVQKDLNKAINKCEIKKINETYKLNKCIIQNWEKEETGKKFLKMVKEVHTDKKSFNKMIAKLEKSSDYNSKKNSEFSIITTFEKVDLEKTRLIYGFGQEQNDITVKAFEDLKKTYTKENGEVDKIKVAKTVVTAVAAVAASYYLGKTLKQSKSNLKGSSPQGKICYPAGIQYPFGSKVIPVYCPN